VDRDEGTYAIHTRIHARERGGWGGWGEGAGGEQREERARERQNSDIVSDNPEGIPCGSERKKARKRECKNNQVLFLSAIPYTQSQIRHACACMFIHTYMIT